MRGQPLASRDELAELILLNREEQAPWRSRRLLRFGLGERQLPVLSFAKRSHFRPKITCCRCATSFASSLFISCGALSSASITVITYHQPYDGKLT